MAYSDEDVPSKFTWPILNVELGRQCGLTPSALHVHLAISDELFYNKRSEDGSRSLKQSKGDVLVCQVNGWPDAPSR